MECQRAYAYPAIDAGVVHIVDDDDSLRDALIRLVRSDGLDAVGHSNASQLRNALSTDLASCVILDMRLDGENGLQVQAALRGARAYRSAALSGADRLN